MTRSLQPSWPVLASYSLYAAPLTATAVSILSFIPALYSEAFGLPLASVGACLLGMRIIDAAVDPAIGWIVDHSPFRARHRPWLILALPLYLVSVGLLFFPVRSWVSPAYLFGVGGAAYAAFTLGQVAHQAWGAALADGSRALSRLFGFREVAVILGILGAFLLVAGAEQLGGGDVRSRAVAAGAFILGGITLATFVTCAFTPDPQRPELRPDADPGQTWRFLASRDFVLLSLATVTYNFAWVAYSVLGAFVARHVFGVPKLFALGLAFSFVVAPAAMPVWMALARRLGGRGTLLIASVFLAGGFALLSPLSRLPGGAGYFAFCGLLGAGFGAGPYLLRTLTGTLANDHEARTGAPVRGVAYAVITFFDKAGSGLGSISLLVVAALGFDPLKVPTPAATTALLLAGSGAPILGLALTFTLVLFVRSGSRPQGL